MISLFEHIRRHISLGTEEEKAIMKNISRHNIMKNTILFHQDQRCDSIFFVEKGMLRAFHMNEKGRESTIMFAISGWWITDMEAFQHQQPASISLEAVEKTSLIKLRKQTFDILLEDFPKMERYFRILFQNAYIREQNRVLENISSSVEERYFRFLKRYPQIVGKITQKQLAPYLGVTPEFLSQIKKNFKP